MHCSNRIHIIRGWIFLFLFTSVVSIVAAQQPEKPKKTYHVSAYTAEEARRSEPRLSASPLPGDVNGDGLLSLADAVMIKNHLLETEILSGDELLRADADGDGKVTLADMVYVRSRLSLPTIAANIILLDELTTLTAIQVTTHTLTLSGSGIGAIEAGNILAGSAGGGFLRRVVSIQPQGLEILVQTEQAALADAVENGCFSGVYVAVETASASGEKKLEWVPATAETRPMAATFTVDLSGRIVHEDANLTVRIVEGSISFTPEIEIEGSIEWFQLCYFRVFLCGEMNMTAVVRSEVHNPLGSLKLPPKWTLKLLDMPISPAPLPLAVGPVPIVLDLEGTVGPALAISVPAAMTLQNRVEAGLRCGGGGEYRNGAWHTLSSAQTSASGAIEEWGTSNNFSAKLSYSAAVGLKFYKVAGPYIKFGPYAKLVGEVLPQFALSLYGGLDLGLSLNVSLLDWVTISYEVADFTVREWLITRTTPGVSPTVGSFSINNGVASTASRNVTLNNSCTGSPTHYKASESSSFSGAIWRPYSTASSFTLSAGNGTKTVYFKVKNAAGESAPASDSITLNESGGLEEITIYLPGDVPLTFVRVPAGSFLMGRYAGERSSNSNEGPQHAVTIGYNFYMGKYELTQRQWLAVMGSWRGTAPNSSYGVGDNYPAYYISWNDCQNFLTALNAHVTSTGQGPATFRLPSEAEWEYACRAGTQTRFFFGDSLSVDDYLTDGPAGVLPGNRSDYMWFGGNNTPYGSKPVGTKLPNQFGLYDMSGNVWEWCQDYWHNNYTGAPTDGGAWVSPTSSYRVLRGGNWGNSAGLCRSAIRDGIDPDNRYGTLGVRFVRTQ